VLAIDDRPVQRAGRTARWRCGTVLWFALPLGLCPLVAAIRPGDAASALARAEALLAWEQAVGIAVEPEVHAWFSDHPALHGAITAFYFGAHLAAVIATACWLAARRPAGFAEFRRTFATAQVLTVLVYLALPVAPLRMVLTDAASTGSSTAGWTRSVQYELAAMPSGHVVFAVVVAAAVWRHAAPRWRWIGPLHAGVTLVAVVATAHHLLADALAAVLVVVTATALVRTAAAASPPAAVASPATP
jgi:hypothetical protein